MSEVMSGPILAPEEISALLAEMAPDEEAQALFATLPPLSQPASIESISFDQMKSDGPEKYEPFVQLHQRMQQHLMDRWLAAFFKDSAAALQSVEGNELKHVLESDKDQVFLIFDCAQNGRVLMTIDKVLIVAIVNVMLGGTGDITYEAPGNLSPVELRLAQRIATQLSAAVGKAWESIPSISLQLRSIETSGAKVMASSKQEECTSATFQLQLSETVAGELGIHYLPSFTGPVIEMMRHAIVEEEADLDAQWQADLCEQLDTLPVTLKLELGSCWLEVKDFLQLKVGDFLPLRVRESDPVKLYVESEPIYFAFPGQKDGMVAAEIVGNISEESHD